MGAVLVANSTRPGCGGVSVLVVGNRLGLQIRKPDDKHVNANGEYSSRHKVVLVFPRRSETVQKSLHLGESGFDGQLAFARTGRFWLGNQG
jgi:hypothetical protein